jgi:hypothetical protein
VTLRYGRYWDDVVLWEGLGGEAMKTRRVGFWDEFAGQVLAVG